MKERFLYILSNRWTTILIVLLLLTQQLHAQNASLQLKVVNDFTKEPVSFASVNWKKASYGGVTDSAGEISIKNSLYKFSKPT